MGGGVEQSSIDIETFISEYLKEIREGNAAVFVGAGLSRAAGYVDWAGLMAPIAHDLGLDTIREHDLVGVAQFHVNSNSSQRHRLNQLLVDEFSDLRDPTKNHILLSRLPVGVYWTTNYDRLIEHALELTGKRVDTKYAVTQLATTKRGRDAVIYKMHGDIEHPDSAILTKDDYERYHRTHTSFITALAGDLIERTFLFLGFSFTDPNLDYVLGRIRATFAQNQRRHYCIMKKRFKEKGESNKNYQYAVNKQVLLTDDLMRFNIKTLFVDDYSDITRILETIVNRYRRRTVFISGSAVDYGEWGREATDKFLMKLSAELIKNDYRIASGFGLGVGGAVVTGATQEIYSTKVRSIEEQLLLRPFPLGIKDDAERGATFQRYRKEMLSQSGIAIFIMGNKTLSGITVDAGGMKAEFEIAKKLKLYPIPIGGSGFVAEQIWTEIMGEFDAYFPNQKRKIKGLLQKIGNKKSSPDTLVGPVVDLVNLLAKE